MCSSEPAVRSFLNLNSKLKSIQRLKGLPRSRSTLRAPLPARKDPARSVTP